MLDRLRNRMTYANVTATLALFLALTGGIAWALEANSVRSKHIVDDQVKSQDVRDDSLAGGGLSGADIREDTLGEVPQAASADNAQAAEQADNAALLDNQDSSAFQSKGSEGWTTAPLSNVLSQCNWTNYGNGFNNAAQFRDQDGLVHLRGLVRANDGTTFSCGVASETDRVITVLSPGYTPAAKELFTVSSNNKPGRVDVMSDGQVVIEPGYPTFADAEQWVSLDGITFRCGPSGQNGCP